MKKKLFIFASLLITVIIIGGGNCNNNTIVTPPPTNNKHAIKLYTENTGLTWEVHNIAGSYDQAIGISSFSYDLSTFSVVVDTTMNSNNTPRILKTTNYGDNWVTTFDDGYSIADITHSGTGNGFILEKGLYQNVHMTSDDGTSWNIVYSNLFRDMHAIDFGDEMNGIIIPENPGDSTLITTNGGLYWSAGTPITSSVYINAIGFYNSTGAVACGNNGKIFRTTDIGVSWTEVNTPTTNDLQSIDFRDPIGIIVGNNGTILRSDYQGAVWFTSITSATNHLRKVYLSDLAYWACGDNVILKSLNTGSSWGTARNVSNEYYKDLFFIKNAGFVVGVVN